MKLKEAIPYPQESKTFHIDEAVEELRNKLGEFLFREFLNDLTEKSSWDMVKMYPKLKLTAIRVTMLRNILAPPDHRLRSELRRFEKRGSHLRIVSLDDTVQEAA